MGADEETLGEDQEGHSSNRLLRVADGVYQQRKCGSLNVSNRTRRSESTDSRFYSEELSSLKLTKRIVYLVDKKLDASFRRAIRENLFRWSGYGHAFDS